LQHVFAGHQREVFAVAFSPDSRYLASAADNFVRLWDVKSGEQRYLLDHGDALVSAVAYSPTGDRLATYSISQGRDGAAGNFQLWNAVDGAKLVSWMGQAGTPAILAFSPNGDRLASGFAADGTLQIWSCQNQELLATNDDFGGRLFHIEFSTDGRLIGGAGESGAALFDAQTGKLQGWLPLRKSQEAANNISFSATGELVSVATFAGDVMIFECADRKLRHTLAGAGTRAVFDPQADRLAAVSPEGQIKIWNTHGRRKEMLLEAHQNINALGFVDRNRKIAIGTASGRLLLFDAIGGQLIDDIQAHDQSIHDLETGPEGK
jgi:WD40 repeat protein